MKKFLWYILLTILFLPLCSATHYILGTVEDAKDLTEADNHTIFLWNPAVGTDDNLTDIIGPFGNSGQNNNYSIDCELLNTPCGERDTLSLTVIDNGDNYVSEEKNVTVTVNPEDYVENITLNSPPTTSLIYPENSANISNSQVNFNCSASDLDENLKEISLYGNWTGEWYLNETKEISLGEKFIIFTKTLLQGFYKYNCKVTDNLFISSFSSQNNTFTMDLTKPVIESIFINISSSCGKTSSARINCTTYDELLKIDNVVIQAISPSLTVNYGAYLLAGETYYSDILLNETGSWKFNCLSNDSAGNIDNLTSEEITVYSDVPELFVNYTTINLNESNPIENQIVQINADIENLGCINAENILIGFFDGDPNLSGENIGNVTINISQISYTPANISWNAKIGPNNIFVFADYNGLTDEENESNNKANKTISINAWQYIYGNTSVDKIIGGETVNLKKWFNESSLEGNIFITDSECYVNWLSLQAIGKTKTGGESSNDFLEIDELLNMTNFEDSVSSIFSENQNPKATQNIIIYQKEIQEVPIINSISSSDLVTGILWDSSDDSLDGEFDSEDKEDIVFISPIKKNSEGSYGFYDYEIRIPSRLREYNPLDSQEVYLYYELN
jgi:hypothetical protein